MGTPYLSPLLESLQGPFNVAPSGIGLLLTAFYLPTVFITPLVGTLVDRVGRKLVLVVCLLMVGGAGVAISATTSFPVVLALRLVQGAGAAGILLSIVASLGDFYSGEAGVTAQGVRMTFHSFGTMVLPIVAGVLIAYGWQYPFLLYGIAIPIAAVVYLTPGLDSPSEEPQSEHYSTPTTPRSSPVQELVRLVRRRYVLATVAGMVLPGFFLTAFLTYTSIIVNDIGGTPQQAGILIAIFGLASGVGASQSGRLVTLIDRKLTVLLVGNANLAASLVLLGIARTTVVIGCSAVTVGVGFGILLAVYRSSLTEIAPDHLRGGLSSLGEAANAVGLTTPPVVMGSVINYLTPSVGEIRAVRITVITFGLAGAVFGLACAVVTQMRPQDGVSRDSNSDS